MLACRLHFNVITLVLTVQGALQLVPHAIRPVSEHWSEPYANRILGTSTTALRRLRLVITVVRIALVQLPTVSLAIQTLSEHCPEPHVFQSLDSLRTGLPSPHLAITVVYNVLSA